MGDFGAALRREREAREIALETITRETKISSRHLAALEAEQFQLLPGGVFNKNIVREYARVVGLDAEEWVERFLSAYRSSSAFVDHEAGWVQFAENASKAREAAQGRRPDMRLRWAGIGILLLFVAGLCWFAWSYVHRKMASAGHSAVVETMPVNATSAAPQSLSERNITQNSLPSGQRSDNVLEGGRKSGMRGKFKTIRRQPARNSLTSGPGQP